MVLNNKFTKACQLRFLAVLIAIFGLLKFSHAQTHGNPTRFNGIVSYVTSENVYLRFPSTEHLGLNDTVFRIDREGFKPCLVIQQKSSVSCISRVIGDCVVQKGDSVAYFYFEEEKAANISPAVSSDSTFADGDTLNNQPEEKQQQNINGRISLANYTSFGSQQLNSRSMARLALSANHIGGSDFSLRTYMHYRHSTVDRENSSYSDNRFNVYQLAADYEFDNSISITAGRFINRKMASVGAIDGLTVNKDWQSFYGGVIAGFRPDPVNYKVNTDLFQAGAYAGIYHGKKHFSFTNIGFMNQNNQGSVDRRYLFLQHQSALGKKVLLFASSELDIYNESDTLGTKSSSPKLTSLYFSVSYRPTTKLSLSASYDVRQNIILYQSFEDNLDNLIMNDPIRTGIRLNTSYRFSRVINSGVNLSFRTQNDQRNDFYSVNLYTTLSGVGFSGGSFYFGLAYNDNTAFSYQSLYVRYTQPLAKSRAVLIPYYRGIRYDYGLGEAVAAYQHYAGLDCSFRLTKLLSLGFLYEFNMQKDWTYNRLNLNLIQRF